MLKIFTTQLVGKLKKIESDQEYNIEDAARLLAQALVGEGSIYIYAQDELTGIYQEALYGQDSWQEVKIFTPEAITSLSTADRVIMFSRNANDEEIIQLAKSLRQHNVPFVAVAALPAKEETVLEDLSHVFINTYIDKGIVPTETGERKGFPTLIGALFVFQNIKMLLDEIMEDYQ